MKATKPKKSMTLIEIRKQMRELQQIESQLRDREWVETHLPLVRSLVGETYVYRNNSYDGDSPKWDVFKRVLGIVEKDGWVSLICEECEIDGRSCARIAITTDTTSDRIPFLGSGWVKCKTDEYVAHRRRVTREMSECRLIRKSLEAE